MKPLGIEIALGEQGPAMRVTSPSRAEEAVWEAVELAIDADWTVKRLLGEVMDSWMQIRRDQMRDEEKQLQNAINERS